MKVTKITFETVDEKLVEEIKITLDKAALNDSLIIYTINELNSKLGDE